MRIFLISFFIAYSFIVDAQNKHHLFVQAVQPKLFFVEINHTVFPSSASGLFFLTDLGNSPLELQLSFPPARYPIYQFNIDTTYLDHVVFLEQLADSSWHFLNSNPRNSTIGKQLNNPVNENTNNSIASTDVFLNLLSNAVDDQEIRQATLIERNDIPQVKNNSQNISKINTLLANASVIKLIYRNKNALVFTEKLGNYIDTIKVEIPMSLPTTLKRPDIKLKDKSKVLQSSTVDSTNNAVAEFQIALQQNQESIDESDLRRNATDTVILSNTVGDKNKLKLNGDVSKMQKSIQDSFLLAKQSQKQFKDTSNVVLHLGVEIKGSNEVYQKVVKQEKWKDSSFIVNTAKRVDSNIAVPLSLKNNCKRLADERDLILFRRKMILMNSQKELISFATIELKQKCYTTIGIRNLGFIFLNDKDKLQFFELAYAYVYDPENFPTLERFLNNPEDIIKFRAGLKN